MKKRCSQSMWLIHDKEMMHFLMLGGGRVLIHLPERRDIPTMPLCWRFFFFWFMCVSSLPYGLICAVVLLVFVFTVCSVSLY